MAYETKERRIESDTRKDMSPRKSGRTDVKGQSNTRKGCKWKRVTSDPLTLGILSAESKLAQKGRHSRPAHTECFIHTRN